MHLHCGRSEGFHDTVSDNSVIVVQRNSSHELQVRIKEPQRNSQWRVHNAVVNSKDSFEVRFSNGPHSFFECRHRSTMIEYHFFNIGKPPAAMVWVRVPHDYEVEPPIHYDYEVCLREHTQDAIVRLSNNILVVTRLGRRILKDREISRAWYGVDEHRGIDCTQEVQQLVNGGSTVRAENGLVSYDPAPFTRKVLKIFFEVEVEEGSSWTRRRGRRWSSMRSKINFPNRLWAMKNDPCSAKHRMPFLQIFADQLSQTAASLPGANVKHPSSAAVWAYAHLDIVLIIVSNAFCAYPSHMI